MADLLLDWASLPTFDALPNVPEGGVSATVETGGIAVDVAVTPSEPGAYAFEFQQGDGSGYVGEGEAFDGTSYLKFVGVPQEEPSVDATLTTVLTFRSTDDMFTDSVQNVSFRLNDIDQSATNSDLSGPAGAGFSDNVTIMAYAADGSVVPVTFDGSGAAIVSGNTAIGTVTTTPSDADGSLLVTIPGPITRIEFVYDNGGAGGQAALAGKTLKEMGYQNVTNVGGIGDWKDAGGPMED